jgi:hypothetical protein
VKRQDADARQRYRQMNKERAASHA